MSCVAFIVYEDCKTLLQLSVRTDGLCLLFCSEGRCPLRSTHRTPKCAFLCERGYIPLRSTCSKPHYHGWTSRTFASGLSWVPLLWHCRLQVLFATEIQMDSLQECHHPQPSERQVLKHLSWCIFTIYPSSGC